MSIAVNCPNCMALFRLGEELAGKKVRCQKCQHIFVVVQPEPEVSESAPPEAPSEPPPAPALPNMEIDDVPHAITSEPPPVSVPLKVADDENAKNDADDEDREPRRPRGRRGSDSRSARRDRRDRAPSSSGLSMTTILLLLGGFGLFACVGCTGLATWSVMVAEPRVNMQPPIMAQDKAIIGGVKPGPVQPPVPRPTDIKVVLDATGFYQNVNALAMNDPTFQFDFNVKRGKVYVAPFNEREEYQIDLVQNVQGIDPYLYVQDDRGAILARDDDSGGALNSRILFRPTRSGTYRIYAASLGGNSVGPYTLTIRRIGPPAPVVKNAPPPDPVAIADVTHRLISFKKSERLVDGLIWARDGKSFYVLNQNGLLQRILLATGVMDKQNDFARRCGNLAISGEGLLLSMLDSQEVWVVDPENLTTVKRKIPVPGLTRVSAGRDSELAVASGGGGFGGSFYLLNLKRDTFVKQYTFAINHLIASPDGKYAFAQDAFEQLVRFRIEANDVFQEDSTPRIAQNGQRICVSPDSKYVALPSGGGNNQNAPAHPPIGVYGTYVYAVNNLKVPQVGIQSGAYPRAIGFDSKSGLILAQNQGNALMLFTFTGIKKSEHNFNGFRASDLTEISVSPLGFEALLRSNDQVVHVTLKK